MATTYRAPGRVNLIGEHTDYNDGFALPIAIDLECRVTASPSDSWIATSRQFGETRAVPTELTGGWIDYVAGVVREFGGSPKRLEIDSTVPVGSGLSSSASLEIALALACLDGATLDGTTKDRLEFVRRVNRVERDFIGLPCGIMDQYASVFGEEGKALLLDCRAAVSRSVAMPDVSILVVNSMVKHSLAAGSAYKTRVAECAVACRTLGVASLRDIEYSENLPPRARHIASENARVHAFVDAAERGDLADMGRLMYASHESLRADYEVSCEELDALVELSRDFPGVHGARMTGAGFGGCVVALVDPGVETSYEEFIADGYRARFGITPAIQRVRPSAGAGLVVKDS